MQKTIVSLSSLIVSIILLIMGNAFLMTLLSYGDFWCMEAG